MPRDDGGLAFPRPSETHPNGERTWGEGGMSYRDWLVGGMMRDHFRQATSNVDRLSEALIGSDEVIRHVVREAHRVADIIIAERNVWTP